MGSDDDDDRFLYGDSADAEEEPLKPPMQTSGTMQTGSCSSCAEHGTQMITVPFMIYRTATVSIRSTPFWDALPTYKSFNVAYHSSK